MADVRGGRLMIYDARTNPRGFKLRIDQWPKDAQVRRIAAQLGYRVPAPNFTAPDATPARALLNHGVWRAWCPDCAFAAEDVWRGHNLFWCMRCGNLKAGRAWRPLIWPDNWQQIERDLDRFPSQAQNWEPWGTPVDHVAEAEAWVAHAAVMIDPEHGLSDNEVGGADDPETYTTPVLAVTNAIIASSDANVDKGDIRYYRQYLSADPGGSGYWLQSSSTSAAAWVARATAVVSALAEAVSPTLTDNLTFGAIKGIVFRGNGGATPSGVRDYATQGLVFNVHADSMEVYDQGLANQIFQVYRSGGVSYGRIGGNSIIHLGNDGSGCGFDADLLDGQHGSYYASGGAGVPSGLIAMVANAAAIPTGWSRESDFNGRSPIGDDLGSNYTSENNYGAATHVHAQAQHVHNVGGHTHGVSITSGGVSALGSANENYQHDGSDPVAGSHTHSVSGTTGADSSNTSTSAAVDVGSTSSLHPVRAVVFVSKD
ncbi:MAG: hypothetical protein AB7P40_16650 [Chloroflexota bacterium]